MFKTRIKQSLWIAVILLPFLSAAQSQKPNFSLTGTFSNVSILPAQVYLKNMNFNNESLSAQVIKGKYVINGTVNGPTKFNIIPKYEKGKRPVDADSILFIYLDEGNVTVTHQKLFSTLKVTGSKAQDDRDRLNQQLKGKEWGSAAYKNVEKEFLKENPNTGLGAYLILSFAAKDGRNSSIPRTEIPFSSQDAFMLYRGALNAQEAIPFYEKLPERIKSSDVGHSLADAIETATLDEQAEPFLNKIDSLGLLYKKASNSSERERLESQILTVKLEMNQQVYVAHLLQNKTSRLALTILEHLGGSNFDDPKASKLIFDQLDERIKRSDRGLVYSKRLQNALAPAPGNPAKEIKQPDTSGKTITLSSLKGNYVLVDFWASWCMPCRKETPNMRKLYDLYHQKGFEIIGISLDTDRKSWLKAIKDDQMPWIQVSDLKKSNAAMVDYDILGIPSNVLVDPSGKVVAKNLFGEILSLKLAELIK